MTTGCSLLLSPPSPYSLSSCYCCPTLVLIPLSLSFPSHLHCLVIILLLASCPGYCPLFVLSPCYPSVFVVPSLSFWPCCPLIVPLSLLSSSCPPVLIVSSLSPYPCHPLVVPLSSLSLSPSPSLSSLLSWSSSCPHLIAVPCFLSLVVLGWSSCLPPLCWLSSLSSCCSCSLVTIL